ncbi:asparagine synthase (glutamine-hydrolyzing) [Silicimonas sp. MF1-12-2]|uniref:asparagine synthase (glutamine-hydrolyzing) n=1 Tax=Silicimonas sp. MF1-12-2 TaxID=3384793 RepID=UPI0039B39CF4
MCGLAGILCGTDRELDPSVLFKMGEALIHRGPDNTGVHTEGRFGVVHTRLSIIDLSDAGNQPFRNSRFTLVYNGEIYNYLELRDDLEKRGIAFDGASDTEVLFHALIEFGVDGALRRLRGMFAFAFFDGREQILFLCRDRLGIKPLHFLEKNGDMYFASEVKAIAQATSVDIDPIKLLFSAAYMFDGSSQQTVFRGIRSVLPGTYLTVRPGQAPKSHTYYHLSEDISAEEYRQHERASREEIDARFVGLLDTSIQRMLMSDAPMGVFASGGIDSSLIAAMALEKNPELRLFSANVVGKYSEIEDARLLSREIGSPLAEAKFGEDRLNFSWARSTYYYELPIVTHFNALPLGDVAEVARRENVKAVLTGEGADELFLGYPVHVARRYQKLKLPVELMIRLYGIVPMVRRYLFPKEEGNMFVNFGKLVSNFEEEIDEARFEAAFAFLPKAKRSDQLATAKLLRCHLPSLLHRNDRMGMMASIESRFPFLDEDIIRFALNLPARFKIRTVPRIHNRRHPFLVDKAIVRQACVGRVPDAIAKKVKMGFPTFGHQSMVVKPGFFDGGFIEDVFELSGAGKAELLSAENRFFAAVFASLEVFGRLYGLGESQEAVTEKLNRYIEIDQSLSSKAAAM